MTVFFPWPVFWYMETGEFFPSADQKQSRINQAIWPDYSPSTSLANRGIRFYV